MTLFEVVRQLDELDGRNGSLTIYVVKPWRPDSEAIVVEPPADGDERITFRPSLAPMPATFWRSSSPGSFWKIGGQRLPIIALGSLTHILARGLQPADPLRSGRRLSRVSSCAYRSIALTHGGDKVSAHSNVEQSLVMR